MKIHLWIEFILFYLVAPVAIAVFMDPTNLFPMLLGSMLIGIVLLHFTPDFRWRNLIDGWSRIPLTYVITVGALTAAIATAVMVKTAPQNMFNIIQRDPMLMAMIAVFYPFLSALPQEIVFRPLFFRRYKPILGHLNSYSLIGINAAIFSLAHLMYWSPIVMAMTFFGGLLFAWAYVKQSSFPLAFVLHSVTGVILFALGMGVYFYSGNVVRPF